ncbi:MAG: hypothetical protein K940chlam3_00237 [Chlamydiae bacterium]|nr:hypothetical protein [Chlamydiota bacterium]
MKKFHVFLALALVCNFGLYGARGSYENSSDSHQRYFQPSYESQYKDRQIKNNVQYHLQRHPGYRNTLFDFSVNGGVVTILGTTDSETTKAEISRDLRRITGVKRVQNDLKVDRNSARMNQSSSNTQKTRKTQRTRS